MDRGRTELSSLSYQAGAIVDDSFGGALKEQFAIGMGGDHRAVAGQGQAEGLVEAVHGVGGEHSRAGAAGRAGAAFHPVDLLVAHLAVGGHDHGIDQIVALVAVDSGLHWAAGDKNGRDIQAHGGHQHAGGDLVAVADADHRIDGMGVAHILDAVGDQIPGRQGVEHAGMAHGDTVINGDGVELGGKTTGLGNNFFQMLADFMEVNMAGDKLGKGVDDADNRFAELLFFNAVGPPEASGTGHSVVLRWLLRCVMELP